MYLQIIEYTGSRQSCLSKGTKCAGHYLCMLAPDQQVTVTCRLNKVNSRSNTSDPKVTFNQRIQETDEFYSKVQCFKRHCETVDLKCNHNVLHFTFMNDYIIGKMYKIQ